MENAKTKYVYMTNHGPLWFNRHDGNYYVVDDLSDASFYVKETIASMELPEVYFRDYEVFDGSTITVSRVEITYMLDNPMKIDQFRHNTAKEMPNEIVICIEEFEACSRCDDSGPDSLLFVDEYSKWTVEYVGDMYEHRELLAVLCRGSDIIFVSLDTFFNNFMPSQVFEECYNY